jgi:hypothetical protein
MSLTHCVAEEARKSVLCLSTLAFSVGFVVLRSHSSNTLSLLLKFGFKLLTVALLATSPLAEVPIAGRTASDPFSEILYLERSAVSCQWGEKPLTPMRAVRK